MYAARCLTYPRQRRSHHQIRRSMEHVRSVRRNPYRQVSVLPAVRHRRHCPVPSSQSVRKSCERVSLGSPEPVTYSASVLGVTARGMHGAPGRAEAGPAKGQPERWAGSEVLAGESWRRIRDSNS